MKQFIISVLSVGLLFSVPVGSLGAEPAPAKPAEAQPAKAKYRPFNGTIKTVQTTDPIKTITLQGKQAQQFLILAETKISRNGQEAKLTDLAPGDKVGGRARQNAEGKWEAVTLNAKTPAAKSSPAPVGEDNAS